MTAPLPRDENYQAAQVARPIGVATAGTANFQNTSDGEDIYIVQNLSTSANVYYIVASTNSTAPTSANGLAIYPNGEKAIPIPKNYYLRTSATVNYCKHSAIV